MHLLKYLYSWWILYIKDIYWRFLGIMHFNVRRDYWIMYVCYYQIQNKLFRELARVFALSPTLSVTLQSFNSHFAIWSQLYRELTIKAWSNLKKDRMHCYIYTYVHIYLMIIYFLNYFLFNLFVKKSKTCIKN